MDIISIDVSSSGSSPGQVIVALDVLPPDYVRQFVSRTEGGVVILPDGTVKIVVPSLSPPEDVDIELMKLNLQAHGVPPGERERVVVAIQSNTYPPGGDTPEDVAYSPAVELWVMLPSGEETACDAGRVRVYSVQGDWSLLEHRCESDESGNEWAVVEVERLGAFALVIDDSPAPPTPNAGSGSAGDSCQLSDRECVFCDGAHVAACTAADACADRRSHRDARAGCSGGRRSRGNAHAHTDRDGGAADGGAAKGGAARSRGAGVRGRRRLGWNRQADSGGDRSAYAHRWDRRHTPPAKGTTTTQRDH